MSLKIPFTAMNLFKIYESGYFVNPSLSVDFQIDRFIDRSHSLTKDFEGNTALITWYDNSLETFDQMSEYCQLVITTTPIQKYRETIPQYIVRDLRLFMFKLAQYMRERYVNPYVAITGSVGKSTTSKMIAHLVKDEHTDVLVNLGNHNNRPSVSFYTSNLISYPDYMVLEIAGDSFLKDKSLGNLAELAQPDISVVTSIGGAHLSRYKDELTVAKIKSGLLDGMNPGGKLVLNGDLEQDQLDVFTSKARMKDIQVFTYSMKKSSANAYLISKVWDGKFSIIHAHVMGELVTYHLPGGSEGTIQNSLAALLVLKNLGIPLDEEHLKKFETIKMLNRVLSHKEFQMNDAKKVTLVDDTHNSSIPAMYNIINYFKMLADSGLYEGNKILVFGKTADLGSKSQELHYQFIQPIAEANADYVFLYGDQMKELMKELRKQKILVYHFSNLDVMVEELVELISDRSLIVMKGSVSESDFYKISWKLPKKIMQLDGIQVQ